ncbi:GDSL-type esterase/lipase family protein [Escherichia coli]|nr:GDSL-type esterase/lipase family protein [Escherichia coli]MCV5730502.1 GDSL-type esterase/lipase family protein [Escherichia coli]MCV5738802.1 GDSL-type esterase/lipase family protein [Escherichia coli]HAW1909348.1 hypothetical protein [Escherichia coli]
MATQPTNLPVPSESPRDLKFNAGKIDEYVTSMGWTYTDRFGQKHYTIEGMNYLSQQAMAAYGYVILTGKTFTTGATLNNPNEVLLNTADGEYYKWTGSFASGGKVVPANSTPAGTGGIGPGAWIGVGDASLRAALAAPGGVNLVNGAAKQSDLVALTGRVTTLETSPKRASEVAKRLTSGNAIIIDCEGDSTMWGATSINTGVQNTYNPPAVLKTTLTNLYSVSCTVRNNGIPGLTMRNLIAGTGGYSAPYAERILTSNADIVYCNHGINDSQLNLDIDQYRRDVQDFVDITRKNNKVPILVTPNINPAVPTSSIIDESKSKRLSRYVIVMRDVAAKMDVDLVDNYYYYERTSRLVSPVTLVPDGAHPATEGYKMSGRNMAIPLVSAHVLRKAWDKAGLANSTYYDNISNSRQYQTTGTPFNRFQGGLSGIRASAKTGMNMAVILDAPTDDTVMAVYGLQWISGTISELYENGSAAGEEFGGQINQYNNITTTDWVACYIPPRCKLYAGLHVIGILSDTSLAGASGEGFSISGLGLVPRIDIGTGMADSTELRNYNVVCTNSEIVFDLPLFSIGTNFTLKGCSNNISVINLEWNGTGTALNLTTASGGTYQIAPAVTPAVYRVRMKFNSDKTITVNVGSASTVIIPASPSPWPNMYVGTLGQTFTIRYLS